MHFARGRLYPERASTPKNKKMERGGVSIK